MVGRLTFALAFIALVIAVANRKRQPSFVEVKTRLDDELVPIYINPYFNMEVLDARRRIDNGARA